MNQSQIMSDHHIRESGYSDAEKGMKNQYPQLVRVERDMQGLITSGFRTLGIVSTFIAGVEAQCLSLTSGAEDTQAPTIQAINALLLIGLLLSAFGAVTSLLVARWFDLLRGDELELLDHRWNCARIEQTYRRSAPLRPGEKQELKDKYEYAEDGTLPSIPIQKQIDECTRHKRNMILAKAAFVPLYFIIMWSYPTAIICTVVTAMGVFVVFCLHLDFETMGTLNSMSFKRTNTRSDNNTLA
ncbi:hypothetical protein BDV93DRAFT_548570 [Ceratobasidium sp. AG-I]|nr:hypothetical protein BDV93DRAFT_548570 [Ceratobasidium sp. AG-I]